jgi:hypothetical protein
MDTKYETSICPVSSSPQHRKRSNDRASKETQEIHKVGAAPAAGSLSFYFLYGFLTVQTWSHSQLVSKMGQKKLGPHLAT